MSGDSEEEDYMSDAILQQCAKDDKRPGLVSSRVAKAYKRELKQKEAQAKNVFKPKKVLEKEKREEGLNASLGSENKGFALLSKMGYKPGMAIGKRGEGRSEPVPIEVKEGRGGLGRETEVKRRHAQSIALRHIAEQKKRKIEASQKDSFLQRMSSKMSEQRVLSELNKSQKVCEQLDSQEGLAKPDCFFYWPLSRLPKTKSQSNDTDFDFDDFDDEREAKFSTRQGARLYEEEEEEDEEEEEPIIDDLTNNEKLVMLTAYLRKKYVYCVWCGTRFNDADDLTVNCPGDTADAHDDM